MEKTLPTLQITVPELGKEKIVSLPGTDATGAILPRLEGTAADDRSGVQKVDWCVDPLGANPPFKLAVPQSPNDWSRWNVQNILIPGPAGPHTIHVRCFDGSGNVNEQVINVAVILQYPPKDPTAQEYFSSLIDFIVRRLKNVPQNRFLQIEDLTAELFQPLQSLLGQMKR